MNTIHLSTEIIMFSILSTCSVHSVDSLEDWDFIQGPNFSLEREDFDTLDERLTSAFQHLILPPNWSVLGSQEIGMI